MKDIQVFVLLFSQFFSVRRERKAGVLGSYRRAPDIPMKKVFFLLIKVNPSVHVGRGMLELQPP